MSDLMQVGIGIGLFILIALLTGLVALLVRVVSKLNGVYQTIDRALVGFGQSGEGRLVNQGVKQASTYFDQPTDPAVIQIANLMGSIAVLAQFAKSAGIDITPGGVATYGRAVFKAFDGLTDGVAETAKQTYVTPLTPEPEQVVKYQDAVP
jgi:hypothetical protein